MVSLYSDTNYQIKHKEFMMQNQYTHPIEAVHSWKVEMLNNFSFKIKSTYLKLAVD